MLNDSAKRIIHSMAPWDRGYGEWIRYDFAWRNYPLISPIRLSEVE